MGRREEGDRFDDADVVGHGDDAEFDDDFDISAPSDDVFDDSVDDPFDAALHDAWNAALADEIEQEREGARDGELAADTELKADGAVGEGNFESARESPTQAGGLARPDTLPPLGKLARAIDAGPPYDPDAEDGLLHAGPRALETLVDAAKGRAKDRYTDLPTWRTLPELRDAARSLAAGQTSHRQTALQRLVSPTRMSQTEVCLRLAMYLITHDMVTSTVQVRLPVEDVTRYRHPMFNIHEFMKAKGGVLVQGRRPPYGTYAVEQARHGIDVCDSADGSLVAAVGPGSRLIVHAFAGPTINSSSPIEHATLRMAIGTALTNGGAGPNDLIAVALPRSPRMRELAEQALALPRLAATALSIITVGRYDQIDGIPLPDVYRPVGLDVI